SGHDAAVTALGLHLVFAAIWLGGLITVIALRPLPDGTLPPADRTSPGSRRSRWACSRSRPPCIRSGPSPPSPWRSPR
ncbi:hypothetical protein, partial [Rathayibacter sp. AY1E5]|uniref:hypothetical protein n=1 Tax=Rathayibacter sp. AY1E5 TaxID=2080553 RepID=UPI0011B01A50